MVDALSEDSSEVGRPTRRAATGDPDAWRALFDRERLRRVVALRIERGLNGQVDPPDLNPEVDIKAISRLPNVEQLSNDEAAQAVGLSMSMAAEAHVRALNRLREILAARPVGVSEL
jgi:hypothetical protein